MIDGGFLLEAKVLIESFLVLKHEFGSLQLLYLALAKLKNGNELRICCFFQKIYLHSFKKALIFHCTYFDYVYPVYENHKPVHYLKNPLSSFLLIRDKC
jgi:hypothetical protein